MLKVIFKYRASVFGTIIVLLIGFAMLGFGVDFMTGDGRSNYAIKVNGQTISTLEYNSAKEGYVNSLRNQYGDFYQQILQLIDVNKQTRDTLVNQALILQFATKLGMSAGSKEIAKKLLEIFPEDTTVKYSEFLQRTGRKPKEFENTLKSDIIATDFQNIASDVILVSKNEIKNKIRKEDQAFNIDYVEIDPKNFEEKNNPTDEELLNYYNTVATDFEEKEKVSYDYVAFSPKDFENEIQVDEKEVELYYTENLQKFTTPEAVMASFIIIPSTRGKEDAEKILKRAKDGEDFKALIKEASTQKDDVEPRWVQKGDSKIEVEVEEKIFANHEAGISDLITTKNYFTIVKIDDYKAEVVKTLEEAKDTIKKEIASGLAPAYAQNKADMLKASLDEGKAIDGNIEWKSVTLADREGKNDVFPGLTQRVLDNISQTNFVTEIAGSMIVTKVTEHKDSRILNFNELGDKKNDVIAKYKAKKQKENVEFFAKDLISKIKGTSLEVQAKEKNLKLEKIEGYKKNDTKQGGKIASYQEIRGAVDKFQKKGDFSNDLVYHDKKIYVLQVKDTIDSNKEISEDEINKALDNARDSQRETAIANIINALKDGAEIKLGSVANF